MYMLKIIVSFIKQLINYVKKVKIISRKAHHLCYPIASMFNLDY